MSLAEGVDPTRIRQIATLMVDDYAQRILYATSTRPCTAKDLSGRFGIPLAACYRRIHELEASGLVRCKTRLLNQKGKRVSVYESLVKEVTLSFRNGKMSVRCRLLEGAEQGAQVWRDHHVVFDPDHAGAEPNKQTD